MKSKKETVLVTGVAGFIGSHMADFLIYLGYEVYGIDNLSTGRIENVNEKVKFFPADLIYYDEIWKVIKKAKPKYVFHFGALARIQPSIADPITWNENNTTATLNLLWACHNIGTVKKVVYSGSSSVYGKKNNPPFKETMIPDPKSPYAMSKWFGENLCRLFSELYGLDTTVLRYFNVYGQRQVLQGSYATVIGIFLNQKAKGEKITIVGTGNQKRDFTYVADVVLANYKASQKKGFGTYNIGTGVNYKIKEIAKYIEPDKSNIEYGIKRIAETKVTLADNKEAIKKLGWIPRVALWEGIELSKEGGKIEWERFLK